MALLVEGREAITRIVDVLGLKGQMVTALTTKMRADSLVTVEATIVADSGQLLVLADVLSGLVNDAYARGRADAIREVTDGK